MDRKFAILFAIIITLLIAINSSFFSWRSEQLSSESVKVSRVIDGDTLKLEDGRTIRLANINTPEKGEPFSKEAKAFLSLYENKTLSISLVEEDKYGRIVANLFDNSRESLSLKLVKAGLAVSFLVLDEEAKDFAKAEAQAQEEQKGIWNRSQFFNCIGIEIDKYVEVVKLGVICSSLLGKSITIRDESRKSFIVKEIQSNELVIYSTIGESNSTDLFWGEKNIWNNDRDTAYVFDSEAKFISSLKYGY